ncbi:MAG: hypothetical protein ABSE20_11810 [Acetobacteraceae bacterium]|jgi:hypothetical protein
MPAISTTTRSQRILGIPEARIGRANRSFRSKAQENLQEYLIYRPSPATVSGMDQP